VTHRKPTRREFCARTCIGLSAAALGGTAVSLLQGCNTFTNPTRVEAIPTVSAPESNGTAIVTIDAASPLAVEGGHAIVQTSEGPLLVFRTASDAFIALDGNCTHEVCAITGFVNQMFVCPCHGSQFDIAGQVVKGPADRPLPQHAAQFADRILTITL
jgi:cytochrome b6-f complex iron-sulfur subunit